MALGPRERKAAVLSETRREQLVELVMRDTVGFGSLEGLLRDSGVSKAMVNRHDQVDIERSGRIESTAVRFSFEQALRDAIEWTLGAARRRVDELGPMVAARLEDGSRVNVIISPLAVDGPALSFRRFAGFRPNPDQLVESGTMPASALASLEAAVRECWSLIISGGTGAG